MQAWKASIGGKTRDDDKISQQLLDVERDAWRTWLTTPPTTIAGIIATLEHAAQRPYRPDADCPDDHIRTNLRPHNTSTIPAISASSSRR
jgi:hypothetical protein